MSEQAFQCDTCGSDTHDTTAHQDHPVRVDWWWSVKGRMAKLADAWDEGVIAGSKCGHSVIWDLNPYRDDE